jgi:hypothetical protein
LGSEFEATGAAITSCALAVNPQLDNLTRFQVPVLIGARPHGQ